MIFPDYSDVSVKSVYLFQNLRPPLHAKSGLGSGILI